jgi:Flp pilus assembly protein TadB
MTRQSSLRASDADREAIAERLRTAAVEGRLEPEELDERVGLALRARTYGDLSRLVADLPGRRYHRSGAPVVFVLALRLLALVAAITVVLVVAAVTAAWWIACAVFWLTLRASRRPRHRLAHR